jgi:acyl dehydratase
MTALARPFEPRIGDALAHDQHNRYASESSLHFWARSIGEMNPRYVQPGYFSDLLGPAFGAHPCWLSSVHNTVEYIGPEHTYPVIGETRWTFERPVILGERVNARVWLVGAETKETRLAGPTLVHRLQVDYLGAGADVIATAMTTLFHIDPERARSVGKHAGWERTRYSDDQFTQIERDYDEEMIRGAASFCFEDVADTEELPRVVRGPLTSEEVVLFVGATRPVPSAENFAALHGQGRVSSFIHPESGLLESTCASLLDDTSAAFLGFPAAHDMGPDRIAQCATLVTNWMGDLGRLRELDVRLERPHMLGDTAWFHGSVVQRSPQGDTTGTVTIALSVSNQREETIASGTAVVDLPRRRSSESRGTAADEGRG